MCVCVCAWWTSLQVYTYMHTHTDSYVCERMITCNMQSQWHRYIGSLDYQTLFCKRALHFTGLFGRNHALTWQLKESTPWQDYRFFWSGVRNKGRGLSGERRSQRMGGYEVACEVNHATHQNTLSWNHLPQSILWRTQGALSKITIQKCKLSEWKRTVLRLVIPWVVVKIGWGCNWKWKIVF